MKTAICVLLLICALTAAASAQDFEEPASREKIASWLDYATYKIGDYEYVALVEFYYGLLRHQLTFDDLDSFYQATAGHNTITEEALFFQAKIGRTMGDEGIELFKRVGVNQQLDSLTCGQFPLGMLGLDPFLSTAEFGLGTEFFKPIQFLFQRHF